MINQKFKKILPIIGVDILAVVGSLFGAYIIRFDFIIPAEYFHNFGILLAVFIPVKIATFYFFGLYRGMYRYTSVWDLMAILKATIVSSLLLVAVLGFAIFFSGIPRSIFLLDYILITLMISLSRVSIRLYYTHLLKPMNGMDGSRLKRIICLGAGNTGEKIAREILTQYSTKYKIIGFLDDDSSKHGSRLHDIPILGKIDDLEDVNIPYDEILITAPSISGINMRRIISLCKNTGKRYKIVPSFSELINTEISIKSIRDVSLMDLLGRDEVSLDMNSIDQFLNGKRILVTGAGGSIGSELVRQCLGFSPDMLVLFDVSEQNLFTIDSECQESHNNNVVKSVLGNINDTDTLQRVYKKYRPHVVFHAAAYKHVPIQELHPWTSVETNVIGTMKLVEFSVKYRVEKFVLVSTDKAVHPVNVMGATKRLAERIIQTVENNKTEFFAVRFGNVIGSSGSVIPTFQRQIEKGGPVTITHPEMTRYFMSIPEASQLILQAGALGKNGQIFVLDMGEPIKIKDMAFDLIRLSGFEPEKDIHVTYTGLRPGEKLYEELITKGENFEKTTHKKIMIIQDKAPQKRWSVFKKEIDALQNTIKTFDSDIIKNQLESFLPEYEPQDYYPSVTEIDLNSTTLIKGQA